MQYGFEKQTLKIFCQPVLPEDVGELIDLTVENDPNSCSMAQLQLEGIAAVYNILCRQNFAYLADEVGMGKTYQALGVAAMVWNECPDARILFLSPRQNLQVKWHSDYIPFFLIKLPKKPTSRRRSCRVTTASTTHSSTRNFPKLKKLATNDRYA